MNTLKQKVEVISPERRAKIDAGSQKRTDLLLSTLRRSVDTMGGQLSLLAEFLDLETNCAGRYRGLAPGR